MVHGYVDVEAYSSSVVTDIQEHLLILTVVVMESVVSEVQLR